MAEKMSLSKPFKKRPFTGKSIPGFPGYYASSDGHIWSVRQGKEKRLKEFEDKRKHGKDMHGYLKVVLMQRDKDSGINYRVNAWVHRLVCMAFHGLPPKHDSWCNHINERNISDKRKARQDNRPENLEWTARGL